MSTSTSRGIALRLLDLMRNNFTTRNLQGITALAVDAARWRAERDQRRLPTTLDGPMIDLLELPVDAQRLQRNWLNNLQTDEEIANYLPALAYHFGDRKQSFELLSSESMRQVAEIAGTGQLKDGTGSLTILDYAAGSGAMMLSAGLAAARMGRRPAVKGVEINQEAAILVSAVLYVANIDAEIRVADSLVSDPFPESTADLAVSQPPFGLGWQRQAEPIQTRHEEGWYRFGLPQISDSTWLFATRLVEKLTPPGAGGGRAVTFAASMALQAFGSSNVRDDILRADLLEAMIALPGGLTQAAVPIVAMVFTNAKPPDRRGKVQIVDLRASFQRSGFSEAPFALRADSLRALRDALSSTRDGSISRTVPNDYFLRERRTVRAKRSTVSPVDQTEPSWYVDLRRGGFEKLLADRYGPIAVDISEPTRASRDLQFEQLFDSVTSTTNSWLQRTGWAATRLSALVIQVPTVAGSGGPEPDAADIVSMPISLNADAVSGVITEEARGRARYLLLRIDTTRIFPDYLAGWLNSPHGRDVRVRAHTAASSGSVISAVRTERNALMRLCDELIVPLPPLPVQQEFATAEARLSAASGLIDAVRRDVWEVPSRVGEIKQRFEPLFDRSLATWTANLPYPIGSAMWTLEIRRLNPHAAHKQIFLVWEAYSAFVATVLLSALAQDPLLRDAELPAVRQALANARLNMRRATLGSWNLIVQRLSSRFRERLRSDDIEQRQSVLQLFGGTSQSALERLLSTDMVKLITDANNKRNSWDGHTGAVNDAEQQGHIDYLTGRLEELRELTGSAWAELPCVRAGDAYKQDGQLLQRVELVMGASTPFRNAEMVVGEIMEKGGIYLCVDGAVRPLQLLPLVLLKSSPSNSQDTSYFYNRLESQGVRMVSYHLSESSEVTENFAAVASAIDGLIEEDV